MWPESQIIHVQSSLPWCPVGKKRSQGGKFLGQQGKQIQHQEVQEGLLPGIYSGTSFITEKTDLGNSMVYQDYSLQCTSTELEMSKKNYYLTEHFNLRSLSFLL